MQEPASTTRAAGRLLGALPLLTAIGSTLVLIAPVLSPKLQLYYRDTGRLYYPVKQYIAERLLHGQMPFWDPWTEAGVSLLGQISPGMFHPFTLLYLVLPFDLAFKLNHLLALPMAAAGAYWLARKLGTSPWPSAVAGVVFGCCGYLVSTSASNLPYALGPAGIPAACAALLWLCERPSAKRLLASAALLALCNYSGEPQSALMAGVIGGCCALAMAAGGEKLVARDRFRRGLRAVGWTALWGALALAISMPAVLTGVLRAHASTRWAGLTDEEKSVFALHPARLAALALPRAFDDVADENRTSRFISTYSEYFEPAGRASFADAICIGIPAVLLALFAAFSERRGAYLALAALVLALAATGNALGIHPVLNKLIPGLGLFRYSEKLVAPVSLLVALGAARGVEVGLAGTRRSAALLSTLCGATAILAISARVWLVASEPGFLEWVVGYGVSHSHLPAVDLLRALESSLAMAAAMAIALGLVSLHRLLSNRRQAFSSILALTCCFAALMISDGDLLFVCNVELFHARSTLVRELERRAGASEGRWRFHSTDNNTTSTHVSWLDLRFSVMSILSEVLAPQFEALFHVEGVEPYFSLLDGAYLAVLNNAPWVIYRLFDVRFVLSPPEEMSAAEAKKRHFETFNGRWLGENKPRPRAFLLSRVYLSPREGPLAMFLDANFDPRREALASPSQRALVGDVSARPTEVGEVALHRVSPEKIDIEVQAPARRLLVVAEHFDPGWTATIDGHVAPVITVDALALGVAVPEGSHLVQFRFWPPGLTVACWIALSALALTGVAIGWETQNRRNLAAD